MSEVVEKAPVYPDSMTPENRKHKSTDERLTSLELAYSHEIKQFQETCEEIRETLEKFKNQIKIFIDSKIEAENRSMRLLINDLSNRVTQLEHSIVRQNTDDVNVVTQELREELVEGIRLLGKRVSKSIQDMEARYAEFNEKIARLSEQHRSETTAGFGSIRENAILNPQNLDTISAETIDRLAQLFRKQSLGIKKFNEEQLSRLSEFEEQLNAFDSQSTSTIKEINHQIRKNFTICFVGIFILAIAIVLIKFIS